MSPPQQESPEVQAERAAFRQRLTEIAPERIKVVDESRVEVGMRLTCGYSARGERCHDRAPLRSRIRRSLIGWMGLDGSGVVATHPGTVRGWTFRGFVRRHLVPHLRQGDVVIWDTASIHGVEGIKDLVEAAGAEVLPLPRYSPDLSPIELSWNKIKHVVKRSRAETAQALEASVAPGVAVVRPSDAEGWFKHCGYLGQSP